MTHPTGRRSPRGRLRRGLRGATLALLAAVALSGCRSEVLTTVTVTGEETVDVTVQARFTGEAAEALREDAGARKSLAQAFEAQTGVKPEVKVEDASVVAVADVPYGQVTSAAAVTGLTGVRLLDGGDTVEVRLGGAQKLKDAITAETAGDVDGDAVADAMLASTHLSVAVVYPGGIDSATLTAGDRQVDVPFDGDTAVATRPLQTAGDAVLRVSGDRSGFPWLPVGGGVLLIGAAAFLRLRRPVA